jgi:MFS family permease
MLTAVLGRGGVMSHHDDSGHELLSLIRARRASIQAFMRTVGPRSQRLSIISIVSSGIVSVLTAGPALGGAKFTVAAAAMAGAGDDAIIWRSLCFLAMVLSIVAAITTNMFKSSEATLRLAKAEACHAALEGLETLVHFGQIPLAEAVVQYQQQVAEIPFVPELLASGQPTGGHSHIPAPPGPRR